MKFHPICRLPVVESTDEYYDEVHFKWLPIPSFWIGDFVASHSHRIRSHA